ncbi:multidrug ABC transporter permease/ATP-binding protein [Bacillus pseudomycoides]|uniref:Multidrug ABC transporter permease/ATP-binding protein n=1 Tax=Bacillus pseudomycoides TaxID=64104 RepID=A0AA91VET3_9BACI|nr:MULTISPECIES: ABC transporter transmembrane domain-containing protein [Bacillus]PEB56488.1 multidrug ABC transporter permease/ATP-binding protein [Bacillus sp. AFS098217]PED83599.1 multidrug ABC transporter permease/ATP-binding protein [Bacillus pseudomycoides]PEU12030.1 multidrug ABC transporter permease/ATP-binding protein [Bacillus sp. AFS019443]PEU20225.1 multidrug ABC transporter permease/ATP-binding protein [Bacillus sp. AFS014408]PFW60786.1 multidrug ABC transporter permease/ATP-bind
MFSVLQKLTWFFKEHWKRYSIAIGALLIVNIIEIVPPKVLGLTIDRIKTGSLTSGVIMQYIWILFGATIGGYVLTFIWQRQLFGGAFVLEKTMRSKFMGHLLKMTPTFYHKNRTGDLMARATNDLKAIAMTAGFGILTLVDSSLYMLTIVCMMGFSISWQLTFAALIPLPIMAYAMNIYGKKLHERFTVAQDAFGDMNDKVLESIAGVRVIRAYVQENADEERFHHLGDDVYEKNMKVARIDALFQPTVKMLVGLSYLIGLVYGAFLVFQSKITLGELVSFNVYLGMMIWPMFAIGELINVMQRGNASLDRVNETLAYEPDVKNAKQPKPVQKPEYIDFDDVSFAYPGSAESNLKNVSFSLKQGETLGIVGKTGSGKTTLVRQLLRQYPLGEGEITVSDVALDKIPAENVLSWIGYVPQEHILFSKTAKENILFGNREASEEELQKAIEIAAFKKDLEFLPDGLETLVGEKGVSLSGGQKQRISIARAVIQNPEILILDDSLSAVDARTEAAIIENIRTERSGKTTIITTHRLSAVQHADWILVMDNGEVIEEGTHEELVQNAGWYREQFERQQGENVEGEVNV